MVIEIRAHLGGMTLSNIDPLTGDDARQMSPQEVDPIDEEAQAPTPPKATRPKRRAASHPLVDTTPFGADTPASETPSSDETPGDDDAALFDTLWPLGPTVKLDSTVERRLLRQQRDRLAQLGYEFAPLSQDWHLLTS